MNRRDFLKTSSLFSAALFVQASPVLIKSINVPVEFLNADGVLFRATHEGEILSSRDSGQTWQLHIRLGKEYTVTNFFSDWSRRVHARVAFAGHSFDLVLAKGQKYWRTI